MVSIGDVVLTGTYCAYHIIRRAMVFQLATDKVKALLILVKFLAARRASL